MRIISKYTDYYDYVANAYGGGDNRQTYVRAPLQTTRIELSGYHRLPAPYYHLSTHWRKRWLSVNGRVFLQLSYDHGPWEFLTEENFGERVDKLWSSTVKWHRTPHVEWNKLFNVQSPAALQMSIILKQPVFIINYHDGSTKATVFVLDELIPNLGQMGFARYQSAEQLYQDMAYFVGNQMQPSPDLVVVDNMTDREKVVQHGFDLRQSFRHRKE